jgi:carbon storage regulator
MLVVSRKIGEAVVIGGGIVVRVLDAGGGRIRLGVEAPDEVPVLREEIADRPNVSRTGVASKPALACATRT